MNKRILFLGAVVLSVLSLKLHAQATLYVSPWVSQDSFRGDGSLQHPFHSLEEARDAIREIKRQNDGNLPQGGVTVRLRKGIYELSSGFLLNSEDGGTAANPVIYTAYPGERVLLSGGTRIPLDKLKPLDEDMAGRIGYPTAISHIREVDLRALGLTNFGIHGLNGFRRPYRNAAMELFINGAVCHLARYPDDKKIPIDTGDIVDNGRDSNGIHPGSIRCDKHRLALWRQSKDVLAAGNFSRAWATDQLRVRSMDEHTGIVQFADAHYFGITGGEQWSQYFFFNLPEEIDHPGEYYIDPDKGKLYFYPPRAVQATDTLIVSRLESPLISLIGARHVTISHLDIGAGRGIGIYMEDANSIRIKDCRIRDLGVMAICVGAGSPPAREYRLPDPLNPVCPDTLLSGALGSLHELLYEQTTFNRHGGSDNGIEHCTIENTGCGGISLGGGDRLTLEPAGNFITDCIFRNCGRIDYSYKSPVNIDGVGNRVEHCLFDSCPATAIYLHGNDHLIQYNEIRNACYFVDDQAAIYIGRDPSEAGNTIRWNFFHHIGHFGVTMAVYFDDGACGTKVYGNVFYKAGDRTVFIGGGSYNPVYNNIFIDSKMAFHLDDRLANWQKNNLAPGGLLEFRLKQAHHKDPPYSAAYPWLAGYFDHHPEIPSHNDIENNVLVHVGVLNDGKKEWGPIRENNWITEEDPGFVDARSMNFSLRRDAPVYRKLPGFREIPFADIGPRSAEPAEAPRGRGSAVLADSSWKNLSLRQKIGQTMIMLPDRKLELQMGGGSLREYFRKYPVGGFFMGWKLWNGIAPADKLVHIRRAVREYQAASALPLLFQEDYESGIGIPGMTSFPNEMALGAANSPELAYAYGQSLARESRSVGVQWVLHPVADLNQNPLNPIVNIRSIGDDPDKAIRLLCRQVRGLQDNGVAATIKHFPGDGVDDRDQHLVTSCNSLPMDVWKQRHGKVFQALIDSGVACIMPGHITLPAWQKEKRNGFFLPATLSKELLTGLLKEEMHFGGVIVSDAMTMGGFRGYYDDDLEGEVASFMAGVDVLLWPSYRYMDTLEARIKRGEIPMNRLDDAVQRVWALKERFGILNQERELIRQESPADRASAVKAADAISERSITLVRDRCHALPLNRNRDKKILVVGVAPVGRKGGNTQLEGIRAFARALQDRGFRVDFRHNILYETQGWTDSSVATYDRILVVVARSPHAPFGPLQLSDDEAQTAWAVNALPKDKIIVLSLGSPYLVNEYFHRVNTCINAYSNTPVMRRAVVRALLGEIPMRGVSPVDIDAMLQLQGYPSCSPDSILSDTKDFHSRGGLPNFFYKLAHNQPVTIAYLGGSITHAAGGYREQTLSWLRKKYPGARITAVDAGVGGTGSDLANFRLKKDVLDYHPDLVTVEFAVNDQFQPPARIWATMKGIVRQIWRQNIQTDICFLYAMTGDMAATLQAGRLPPAASAMEEIAAQYNIPSVNMCREIAALAVKGALVFKGRREDFPGKMVFSYDNVHPYPETGHRLYTEAIVRAFMVMEKGAGESPVPERPALEGISALRSEWENACMIPADQLERSGRWELLTPRKGGEDSVRASRWVPDPFPVLLKSDDPGAYLRCQFTGTIIGLYDLVGPGCGQYDLIVDGKLYKTIPRFDAFAQTWRVHYFLVEGIEPGKHTVELRVSADPPDKAALLGAGRKDMDLHPDKYASSACFAGYLLVGK